jgi:signal peptidase II
MPDTKEMAIIAPSFTDCERLISVTHSSLLRPRWGLFFGLALGIFLLDQGAKAWVMAALPLGDSWIPIPLLANFFRITHSTNSGAAFSLFQGGNGILLVISLTMSVGIVYFYPKAETRLAQIALGVLLGGVLGNAMDRLRFGIVIDFFHLQIPGVIANVSNFADHAIVLSVLLLVLAQRAPVRYAQGHETIAGFAASSNPHPSERVRDPNAPAE